MIFVVFCDHSSIYSVTFSLYLKYTPITLPSFLRSFQQSFFRCFFMKVSLDWMVGEERMEGGGEVLI